jgi:hypothetical protein
MTLEDGERIGCASRMCIQFVDSLSAMKIASSQFPLPKGRICSLQMTWGLFCQKDGIHICECMVSLNILKAHFLRTLKVFFFIIINVLRSRRQRNLKNL